MTSFRPQALPVRDCASTRPTEPEHDAASAEEVALLREELAETRVAVRRLESQVAVLAEVVEKEEAQNRRFLEALLTAPPPGMSDQP